MWHCLLLLSIIIIINYLFVPHQYKTMQHHKLQINLESAVYKLKCSKKKQSENCSIEVTRLHHAIQTAFNKTITSLIEKKLPQSNVAKPSRKLNSSSTNDAIWRWATGILFIQKYLKQSLLSETKPNQKSSSCHSKRRHATKPKISTKRRIIFTMNNAVQSNTTYKDYNAIEDMN